MPDWFPAQVPIGAEEWDPPAPAIFSERPDRLVGWLQVDDVDPDATFDPPPPPPPPVVAPSDQ